MALIGSILGELLISGVTSGVIMSLATKDALLRDVSFSDNYRRFALKYPYIDYSKSFSRWILEQETYWYDNLGTGACRRVSGVVDFASDLRDVKYLAKESAKATHRNVEAIKSAIVIAVCSYMAKHGASKDAILGYVYNEYGSKYRFSVVKSLLEYDSSYDIPNLCYDCVPVAIRCFYESISYKSFIDLARSMGGVANKIASVGGGIAEEFYKSTEYDNEKLLMANLEPELYNIIFE